MRFTLRKPESEAKYEKAKQSATSLAHIQPIHSWEYWKLIPNEYPYDLAFKTHHLLLPIEPKVKHQDLSYEEWCELQHILEYFVEPNYDLFLINTLKRRTVENYHIHLCVYKDERDTP